MCYNLVEVHQTRAPDPLRCHLWQPSGAGRCFSLTSWLFRWPVWRISETGFPHRRWEQCSSQQSPSLLFLNGDALHVSQPSQKNNVAFERNHCKCIALNTGIVHPKIDICWKVSHPQAIRDVEKFVINLKQIWRNVALYHLFTSGSSAVNGCRQN